MHVLRLPFVIAMLVLVEGCASDYVSIRPNPGGWLQQRAPSENDKSMYAAIGAKQFRAYHYDPIRASEVESVRLVKEFALCPNGYTLIVNPKIGTGDHGFGWIIRCND
jgi:hypothetical protein